MSWHREPLVHFLAIGAVIFAVEAALGEGPIADEGPLVDDRVIEVDDAVRADLERQMDDTLARPPTPEELERAIATWVRTEVLVREAERLGLAEDDPIVRDRLAKKMALVAQSLEVPPEPGDDALHALYQASEADFRLETRLTFRQLFASDEATARTLMDRWAAGADPRELDTAQAPGGPVLRGRSPARLAELYGDDFASAVDALELETPAVIQSTQSWHVVRVQERSEGRLLSFDEARDRLALRWRAEWVERAAELAVDGLMGDYEIDGWSP